jgi:hypothetical protein
MICLGAQFRLQKRLQHLRYISAVLNGAATRYVGNLPPGISVTFIALPAFCM